MLPENADVAKVLPSDLKMRNAEKTFRELKLPEGFLLDEN